MLRTLTAVALSVAIPLGALCAPLVHAHLDDDHADHHDTNGVHAHFGGHGAAHDAAHDARHDPAQDAAHDAAHDAAGHPDDPHAFRADAPAVEPGADPEHVTRLQIFIAVQASHLAPALPQARYALPPLLESVVPRSPAVVHSHDPPVASASGPRAPPAFPS